MRWDLVRILCILFFSNSVTTFAGGTLDSRAQTFITKMEQLLKPLQRDYYQTDWKANLSGSDADFAASTELANRLNRALADKANFAEAKTLYQERKTPGALSPLLARQVELLYFSLLAKQVNPDLLEQATSLGKKVEQTFNVYRASVAGTELDDGAVKAALKTSKDSAYRRQVWEGSKGVADLVLADLMKVVGLRNQMAKELGYPNYHAMALALDEQDPAEITAILDELDALTKDSFSALKRDIDTKLAKGYQLPASDLMPWHYHDPFFQEVPAVYGYDFDKLYADQDLVELTRRFYGSIGLPIDSILAKGDYYPRPGKSPHAFCNDMDREGDTRILANIVNNRYWASTMIHEFGHGVYFGCHHIPNSLPYFLRAPAHTLTTEALAMLMERQLSSLQWMTDMGVAPKSRSQRRKANEAAKQMQRARLLIFSRWAQVMFRFEKAMYEDPSQNLNKLWWDLVERYQEMKRPPGRDKPDFASKIHVVVAPAYYHNYALGDLLASQMHHHLAKTDLNGSCPAGLSYYGKPAVGRYFKEGLISPGSMLPWNELVRQMTGEPLGAKAFAADVR